ncbi:unnamed protein product [Merluccius merluccius]
MGARAGLSRATQPVYAAITVGCTRTPEVTHWWMLTASQVGGNQAVRPQGHLLFLAAVVRTTSAVSLGLPHSKSTHSKSNHSGRMDKDKPDWKIEKERLLSLNLEERRKEYRRQEFTPLGNISTWRQECKGAAAPIALGRREGTEEAARPENAKVEENEPTGGSSTSDKVSLHKGDITLLEVDAIVNAGNGIRSGREDTDATRGWGVPSLYHRHHLCYRVNMNRGSLLCLVDSRAVPWPSQ